MSLDSLHGRDKFHSFLSAVLRVLSQLLEATSLTEIGRHADEILDYLKTILTAQPKFSVECVQQLLKALFGTNFASHSADVVQGAAAFADSTIGTFLDAFSHLYKRVCPSVRHTRVEFMRNGLKLNRVASGTCNYAIRMTIQKSTRANHEN